MIINNRITALVSIAAFGLAAAACTPANNDQADADATDTRTVVETVEVPGPPVVVERDSPPIVIENGGQPTGDSTTVRADRDGISVETTNR